MLVRGVPVAFPLVIVTEMKAEIADRDACFESPTSVTGDQIQNG